MGLWRWLTGADTVLPTPITTTDEWSELVENGDLPVVLEVWNEGCAPCRRMVPVLETVATRHAGRVRVLTVGSDAEPALLARLRVRATPTILVYRGGAELGRMVGFRPVGWFDEMIAAELSGPPA